MVELWISRSRQTTAQLYDAHDVCSPKAGGGKLFIRLFLKDGHRTESCSSGLGDSNKFMVKCKYGNKGEDERIFEGKQKEPVGRAQ